jgi:hypothetical protein
LRVLGFSDQTVAEVTEMQKDAAYRRWAYMKKLTPADISMLKEVGQMVESTLLRTLEWAGSAKGVLTDVRRPVPSEQARFASDTIIRWIGGNRPDFTLAKRLPTPTVFGKN